MTGRRWRLSVFLFVALLSLTLILQSRTVPTRKSAAFLRYTSGAVILKVTGTDSQDGIYRIIDGPDNEYVKNMTQENASPLLKYNISAGSNLENGTVLEVSGEDLQASAKKMTAVELILLGIPLHPGEMSVDDWDSLPGIGTALAEEIVRYCQNNGGIASVEELAALSGIGEGRIKRISPFFK